MDNSIINIISSVGFPIVITLYLLIKFEKCINKMTDTLNIILAKMEEHEHGIRQ